MAAAGIGTVRPVSYDSEVEMLLAVAHQCTDNIAILIKFIDECILGSQSSPAVTVNSSEIIYNYAFI